MHENVICKLKKINQLIFILIISTSLLISEVNADQCGNNVCSSEETLESCINDCIGLIPLPKIASFNNSRITIDNTWQIVFDKNLKYIDNTIDLLKNTIFSSLQVNLNANNKESFVADYRNISGHENKNIFLLLSSDTLIKNYFLEQQSEFGDYFKQIKNKGFNQGYMLFYYHDSIYILATSSQGIYYGMQSLRQLIETHTTNLKEFNIVDWPDIESRTFFHVGHENKSILRDPTIGLQLLEKVAKYKMNSVHLSSGSMLSHMDNMFIPYADYCVKNFIRPILGQAWPVDIETGAEGQYVLNEPFKFDASDIAIPTIDGDVLENADFEHGDVGAAPDSWRVSDNSELNDQWHLTDQEHHSGSKSLMLVKTITNNTVPMIYQRRDVVPRSHYLARFRVKTEGSTGNGYYQFALKNEDSNGKTLNLRENKYKAKDDGQWHTVDVHLSKYENAKRLTLWIRPRNIYGIIYIDNVELIRMNSKTANTLLKGEHIFKVTDQSGSKVYQQDTDYTVIKSGPDLTSSSIQELTNYLTIKRNPSGNIAENEDITITYDYIFYQDKSTRRNINPFENKSFDHIKIFMSKIANKFESSGISNNEFDVFFMQDEIRGFNMDSRSIKANKENHVALAILFNKLYDISKQVFENSNVFIWGDMINLHRNGKSENHQAIWGGKPGATHKAVDLVNKNIIFIPWDYSHNGNIVKKSIGFFNNAGFKIAGGAGGNIPNIKAWTNVLKNNNNYFYGHAIFAPEMPKEETIIPFANYSWNSSNTVSTLPMKDAISQ
jgi:hypothetical protein